MEIKWENINNKNLVDGWLSYTDKINLCMTDKSWQETANDISDCLKNMTNGQFRNVVGYLNNQPAVAMMFGVEHSGKVLNLYNIAVNPSFRYRGIAKQAISDLLLKNQEIFGLNNTFDEIKTSVVPQNTIAKKLFYNSGFKTCQFDGEYLVFTKFITKNYNLEY